MSVIEVKSNEEFHSQIKSGKLVIVDFFATWCGPCRVIAPKIDGFAKTYPNAVFLKVDVDQLSMVSAEAGIRAMPTFHLYKDGNKIDEVVGADSKSLEKLIEKNYV